jgi:hypothetical protein
MLSVPIMLEIGPCMLHHSFLTSAANQAPSLHALMSWHCLLATRTISAKIR